MGWRDSEAVASPSEVLEANGALTILMTVLRGATVDFADFAASVSWRVDAGLEVSK